MASGIERTKVSECEVDFSVSVGEWLMERADCFVHNTSNRTQALSKSILQSV
jgi:hypothetical protein